MSKLKKALEKAKEARELGSIITPEQEPSAIAASPQPVKTPEKIPTITPPEAERSQAQTRVVTTNRKILKKHKIIAGLEPDAFSDYKNHADQNT